MSPVREQRLPELLAAAGVAMDRSVPDLPIREVTDDSRAVKKDALFVAVQGTHLDGHRFVAQAIERGAAAVVVEQEVPVPDPVVKIQVPSTRAVLGPLVHAFLGRPSEQLHVVGVTGTNGKTTVAWLAQHLLQTAGIPTGLIGTVCHRVGTDDRPSRNTTPGASELSGMLRQMADSGMKACAMEVSSHALDQHRTDGIRFRCAVFTQFSPEHLDYHRTIEEYLRAKLRLFEALGYQARAVINRDDPVWEKIRRCCKGPVLTFALKEKADLTATEIRCSLEGTACTLQTPEGSFGIAWKPIGRHNLKNLLAALGAVMSCGVPLRKAMTGISTFAGVPGRLERVEGESSFPVLVDYAHTDGALAEVLKQLKAVTTRRIVTVFGCGGDRDRTKRPRMGQVAAELSDRVIITSDNPRSEDPAAIAQEVAAGIRKLSRPAPWEIVLDRREAIRLALESADGKELVLIAGKGHETGQIVGDRVIPFDDRAVVKELLSR